MEEAAAEQIHSQETPNQRGKPELESRSSSRAPRDHAASAFEMPLELDARYLLHPKTDPKGCGPPQAMATSIQGVPPSKGLFTPRKLIEKAFIIGDGAPNRR
jgi:hypothetical protein